MIEIDMRIADNVLQIRLVGPFDIASTDMFEEKVARMNWSDVQSVVVDFEKITLIDSTGIGALLNFHLKLQDHGVSIKFVNINEEIEEIFSIIGVDDLLENNNS